MDHQTAELLLTDLVTGKLESPMTEEVKNHVQDCPQCGKLVTDLEAIRVQVSQHGEALFTEHPSADELAGFVLVRDELSTAELARIRLHLAACPGCSAEATWARRPVEVGARFSLLRLLGMERSGAAPAWRPFLAGLVPAAVVAGFLGFVVLPRLEQQLGASQDEMREARDRGTALEAALGRSEQQLRAVTGWGGGASVLVLTSTARDGGSEMPEARLRPAQPFLPVFIDAGGLQLEANEPIDIVLERSDGSVVWRRAAVGADLLEVALGSLSLMLPTADLAADQYSLRLEFQHREESGFSRRFRVTR